ncbi:Phosphatidic acid phosphatase type 2/haloperoxidase [Macrophomina phaseolina MS6]|uniref:Phosphatidic acid phosphatase type 2/haloperoxidase n=1 Tax=Macrophomina phaseolina (strain MS6) TaxID=1126212 RepID=K2SAI4_MACPH|nr:Phosphatidic acid phosphatase type 2/haloperoxidase [Macrophomina phaseolina MS6]
MPVNIQALGLPSKRLVLSYVFDWIVIIVIAAVGAAWNDITPYHRPFSLLDLSISYPHTDPETIPTWLMVVIGLVAPAAIIFFVCLIFVPGPTASPSTPKTLIWRRKFWECNTGWMGLALSLATAFMLTQGMKLIFGKPRPDLLSRCQPDYENVQRYTTGGYGQDISARWVLVTSEICQQTDMDILNDGFKSFPSGHASFTWAGLLYLFLFLCSKFAIAIPFLPPRPYSPNPAHTALEREQRLSFPLPLYNNHSAKPSTASSTLATNTENSVVPIRNQAAAPPNYILVLALVPLGAAIYITASRFFDFRHHGFDLIFGSLMGIVCAWFAFRWYHLPIRQGAGWAWGARSRDRAWGIGVGVGSYVGPEGWGSKKDEGSRGVDVEEGGMAQTGPVGAGLSGPGLDGARDSGFAAEDGRRAV